jgi:hypothetical protein
VGRCRRKLCNEEFDDFCVGKNDEFGGDEMEGSVTYTEEKRD